ncbi:hypothetical protein G6F61_007110 [Rhizopus arrhizus]|nr:hypothetical protein G6F42_006548 [Rhizopus arrhizus]KAG1293208.1 hypothetical protein G6F66_006295 [Rhizopus arrhizus]KAG1377008.1 hypothetical protein G6F61_007110 [Rhizopus arrhizus]
MRTILLLLLLCTSVYPYKIAYCDSNGCSEKSISSATVAYPSETLASVPISSPLTTKFHEAAAVQKTTTSKTHSSSRTKDWQIAVASVCSVAGVAGIAAAIFVLSHFRKGSTDQQLFADQEEGSKKEFSADGNEPEVEEHKKSSESCMNQEWKQLMTAAYRLGWCEEQEKEEPKPVQEAGEASASTPSFSNANQLSFNAYSSTPNFKQMLTPPIFRKDLQPTMKYDERMSRALNKLIEDHVERSHIPLNI